ncbi:ABC transporter permease [Hymenobacter aquaticus]|uniref:ABC transporter permease n=1 Tax=Hymenobacter aquaticus TaxID=1867101 RepID=A0A4Z0PXS8_9BACT|nr:ABC transporter permease [Hymenobacter aquaticus]TGE22056.1 ABC transporter permease [Hymenobacter aquaticus]
MTGFLWTRLIRTVPAAWGIISIIFLLSRSLATSQVVSEELQSGVAGQTATPGQVRATERLTRQRLGLDLPLFYLTPAPKPTTAAVAWRWRWHGTHNQYHIWLRGLLHADLGVSFRSGQPVLYQLGQALRATLPLTATAFLVTIGLARWLTLLLAYHPWLRPTVLTILHALQALPLFAIALLLLLLLANPDALTLFPAYGLTGFADDASASGQLLDYAYHLALPVLSLVLVSLPSLVVQLDAALARELSANYVVTARAKGLAQPVVIRHHALRNALLPAIAYLTDLLPALVAGAVVVELIFALPGVGRLLAEAAASRDFPLLLGGVLLITLARLLAQILADWLYSRADPRIRLEA